MTSPFNPGRLAPDLCRDVLYTRGGGGGIVPQLHATTTDINRDWNYMPRCVAHAVH